MGSRVGGTEGGREQVRERQQGERTEQGERRGAG